ncbi:vacuolar protein sorting-associated protein 41 homolog isoform X5 [Saccostrea echinata]|uniref:vacuolar protein sorting-associated protein 41 homolog isoform X5 n=1 Tax=Saccostrea echinata TaxID=191078 RepID=UPI002A825E2A|nr:vacuolar protein sorting-associated protein 41 homolog isoform X5 [Saccostrea echinata]
MATSSQDERQVDVEEEEEESSSEESEEDVEPKLKYERIGNDLKNKLLSKDCVSCLAVHPKFLAVGTHWGMIHIFDHAGNAVRDKEIAAHTTTVNQLSIDDNGDHIASCSDDGRVMISGLYTSENNQTVNFDRPVKAVAIDPKFGKHGSGKNFVTGDDKLILNERGGLFNRHKTVLLHQGEGLIREIKWKGDFIAWTNDHGVKIFDMSSRNRITFISKDHSYRADQYRCNMCWKDGRTLLLAWADKVKVCIVKDREDRDIRDLPQRYVEIIAMFTIDSFACGISPLGDSLVILTFEKETQEEDNRQVSKRPHLLIVEPHMEYFEEISNDALSVRGFQEYKPIDYHLETISDENLFYIVSPKDIIVSKERDIDDHVTWLLDHEDFEEAVDVVEKNEHLLRKHSYKEVAKQYLHFLLEEGNFEEAARQCPRILGKNKELWEEETWKFQKYKQLKVLAPYLPRSEPQLSPAIYELVLNDFLNTDSETFLNIVKEWPSNLYNVQTIITATLDRLDRERNNTVLLRALGELYTLERQYEKSLAIYLKYCSIAKSKERLGNTDVFQLIHKYNLFSSISDKIVQLMEFDEDQAAKLLIDNMDKLPIEQVVKQLEHHEKFLFAYLDRVCQKDQQLCQAYHGQLVKLYAEFAPKKLLPFLKSSIHYPLQKAMDECQVRGLIPEQVYLLGRMGDLKKALTLITTKLKDVTQAIEFCKDKNDEELWADLIKFSIDKPSFIKGLLHNIGTHVDPIRLIPQIQNGMEIPGLRDSLVKILQDYNLQMSLREGCRRILVADSFNLLDRLVKTQRRGVAVDSSQCCPICQQRIIVTDLRYASNVVLFHCKHAFHEDCLPTNSMERCTICSTQRRGPGSKGVVK